MSNIKKGCRMKMHHILKNSFFVFLFLGPHFQMLSISIKNPDQMLAFVKTLIPDAPVIIEAGGHFGEDTKRMKKVWPDATMHVFEPLPSSFEVMTKETQNLTKVMCYPYALTTYSGKTNFYINIPNNAASSIGYPVEWNEHEFDKTPIEVPCTTLNDWSLQYQVEHVDFMWLDMEGHELYALEHALNILSSVKAIYTEIDFVPLRIGGCLYPDLKKFLESQGFSEVWKRRSCPRFGDALFIKKELIKSN